MRIKSLTVNNFRQFVNESTIHFASTEGKSITVIHGENGSGKTTLLNAFKWGFYGYADFDTGEKNLLNEHAISRAASGAQIEMSVEVVFVHNACEYTARRQQLFKKVEGMRVEPVGGSVLELSWIGPNGSYEKATNAENYMNQILPETMHTYFFFNGERIEKLATQSAANQIRDAIKTLMGLEAVDRATEHLDKYVTKTFKKELKEQSAGELDDIIEEENKIQDAITSLNGEIKQTKENLTSYRDDITAIDDRLTSIKEAATLQEERRNIDSRLSEIGQALAENSGEVLQIIGEQGFLAFLQEPGDRVAKILDEKRRKGELPYRVKQQFIEDLLKRKRCLCERDLIPGEQPHSAVEAFKKSTGGQQLEEAFIETFGELKQLRRVRSAFFQKLRSLSGRKTSLRNEREFLSGRLDSISSELSSSAVEDINKLEARRAQLEEWIEECLREEGRLNEKLRDNLERQTEVSKERKQLSAKSKHAHTAKQKLELAEELARVSRAFYEALSRQTREKLSTRVDKTFRRILRKDYWAEIDEDYTLQVFKELPGHGPQLVVEKSTGESQITSLSFIGSIVSLAKDREEPTAQYFQGGVFPIVMDSPHGSLDDTHKELVAKYIPELADQIILMASTSQWKGPVERECLPRVGKHVSLIHHAPTVKQESHYTRGGAEYEFTEIEEDYNG